MIATLDIADLGARGTIRAIRSRPRPAAVPGLRWCDVGIAARLASTTPPGLRRAVRLAMWDDEDAAVAAREHDTFRRFDTGFHAVLHPIRAFGAWPGLPEDIPRSRTPHDDGPVMVFTLGRLRLSQTVRFLRSSRPAERAAVSADGFLWGTAAARPPFVATVSMWEDARSAAAYAYDNADAGHPRAITAQRRKDFHHQSAFIRFTPVATSGELDGPNAIARGLLGTSPPG